MILITCKIANLWVDGPILDGIFGDTGVDEGRTKWVLCNGDTEPVVSFGKSFKRRSRRMHTIVTHVWL